MNVSGRKALSSRVPTKLGANPWHFQVFNAAKQGLVVIDLQGNVEFQNSKANDLIASRRVPLTDLIKEVLLCSEYLRERKLQQSNSRLAVMPLSVQPRPVLFEFCADWQGNCEIELTVLPLYGDDAVLEGIAINFEEIENPTGTLKNLMYQATHDELTGLDNRRVFLDRLRRLVTETNGKQHALLFMDLDQFKSVNDRCGPNAGDDVLKQVASVLRAILRQRDTLARLGGDEFGVLLEHCTESKAKKIGQKLCHAIKIADFEWRGEPFQLTISIGIVPICDHGDDVASILAAADSACYCAKAAGGSRVTSFRPKTSRGYVVGLTNELPCYQSSDSTDHNGLTDKTL